MRPIELINRLIQTQSKLLQYTIHTQKIERLLARKGVLFGGVLGLNTLCRSCSSHTTLVGLLYPGGDKSEKVYTGYKIQLTRVLNLLKESECRASVQIVLCNFLFYVNNIKKYYSISHCVISIIIVFASTVSTWPIASMHKPKLKYVTILLQI